MKLKQVFSRYLNSWWIPSAFYFLLLAGFTLSVLLHLQQPTIVSIVLFVCLAAGFLGVFCAAVWNFVMKHWTKAAINLVMFPLCGIAASATMGFLVIVVALGPSEDGFADNLSIPENIQIAEPLDELMTELRKANDSFQQALLAALGSPGGNDPTITANVASLITLQTNAPDVLKRYLTTSPSWRVFKEHGNVFATRRWMIGSQWRYDLHGYYSRHDIGTWSIAFPHFQTRFTIGLSGKPWAGTSGDTTLLSAAQTIPLKLSPRNLEFTSLCVITAGDLVVEIFEQSEAKERRLTKASLVYLEEELAPLAAQPTWETIRAILPPDSIRQGQASLELRNSFQPGIYDSIIWINPGEPGMIYLKAFEVTKETPLSVRGLKNYSNEWVGWSNNPDELFFSNTHFTIYEGDWGKPYAARFEIWFTPDSGGPARKLMEKVFKIEGWQR